MMSRSGGLKPRAVAGSPSVTKFTHSSCTGIRASGSPKAAVRKMLQEGGSHMSVLPHPQAKVPIPTWPQAARKMPALAAYQTTSPTLEEMR
jgi:hypothetical protein